MKEHIKNILQKGKSENVEWVDRQEMLALFHQPEKEFHLKESLLKDLEKTEHVDISSADLKKQFAKMWAKIERNQKRSKPGIKYIYIQQLVSQQHWLSGCLLAFMLLR